MYPRHLVIIQKESELSYMAVRTQDPQGQLVTVIVSTSLGRNAEGVRAEFPGGAHTRPTGSADYCHCYQLTWS